MNHKSDIAIFLNEDGLQEIHVGAPNFDAREQAMYLLTRVAPQLRELEKALKSEQKERR